MSEEKYFVVLKNIAEIRYWHKSIKGTVGFIPTMGYLHEGHVSLIKLAQKENKYTVVSIFVNPIQFGPKENFTTYPRDEKHDLEMLKTAGVTVAFLPGVEEMYPSHFDTTVSVAKLSKKLEGERRPGHFDGVATVITKLFNIIQPTRAYFGQKDAQQVVIIKKMVSDLQIPVEIIEGVTIRQKNGLALSSRNTFLTKKERDESAVISQSLLLAQDLIKKGLKNTEIIKKQMRQLIEKSSGTIDYISIADPESLNEIKTVKGIALVSLAVYFNKTRLIDNCMIVI